MPLLTPAFLQKVRDIIDRAHSAFIVNAFGPDTIPPDALARLQSEGLIEPTVRATTDDAYLYGHVKAALDTPEVQGWSMGQVKDWVAKNPVALTAQEQEAAKTARLSAAIYCQGLGNAVEKDTGQLLIEADRALRERMQDQIQNATELNIGARETIAKLKSDLGHATGDWARDLDRIAVTEKHTALQTGLVDALRKRYGDDCEVYVQPRANACPSCKRLALGPDGAPRILKLSQLPGPGSNVGRKQADWVLCAGSIHPRCECQVFRVPPGFGFDESGDLVPDGKYGVRYEGDADDLERSMDLESAHVDILEKARKLAGRIEFQGLPISIEQDVGHVREWKDRNGETGKTVMLHPYGYVRGTEGSDGDAVDVYVGPNPQAPNVYVVHQRKKLGAGKFGGYDEDKAMLGFSSPEEAKRAYLAHYDDEGFFGSMDVLSVAEFKKQLENRAGTKLKGEPTMLTKSSIALVIPVDARLEKGFFVGVHGGKWADAEHTKSWSDKQRYDTAIAHQHEQDAVSAGTRVAYERMAQFHRDAATAHDKDHPDVAAFHTERGTIAAGIAERMRARGLEGPPPPAAAPAAAPPQRTTSPRGEPGSFASRSAPKDDDSEKSMSKADDGRLNPDNSRVPASVGGVVIESDRGPGTAGGGANLQAKAPARPIGGAADTVGLQAWLTSGQPRTTVIKRDPRIYEFDADTIDYVIPINLEDGVMATSHDTLQPIEYANAERQMLQTTLVPRNTANPGGTFQTGRLPDQPAGEAVQQDDLGIGGTFEPTMADTAARSPDADSVSGLENEREDLEKAGPYIGPKGGLWADPQHTVHWEAVPHWAQHVVTALAGAIEPHPEHTGDLTLKVPFRQAHALAAVRNAHGIDHNVKVTGEHAELRIPRAHMTEAPTKPVEAPKPAPVKPKPTPPKPAASGGVKSPEPAPISPHLTWAAELARTTGGKIEKDPEDPEGHVLTAPFTQAWALAKVRNARGIEAPVKVEGTTATLKLPKAVGEVTANKPADAAPVPEPKREQEPGWDRMPERAEQMGAEAAKEAQITGIPKAAAQHSGLIAMLRAAPDAPPGTTLKVLEAYNRGYHAQHLRDTANVLEEVLRPKPSAPVEPAPKPVEPEAPAAPPEAPNARAGARPAPEPQPASESQPEASTAAAEPPPEVPEALQPDKAKTAAESRQRAREVGEHIRASRKDQADLMEKVKAGKLDEVSFADAAKLLRKESLMPVLTHEHYKSMGATPGVAHIALVVSSLVAGKPKDNDAARKAYMDGVRMVAGGLEKLRTFEDVRTFYRELRDHAANAGKYSRPATPEEAAAMDATHVPGEINPRIVVEHKLALELGIPTKDMHVSYGWDKEGKKFYEFRWERAAERQAAIDMFRALGPRFIAGMNLPVPAEGKTRPTQRNEATTAIYRALQDAHRIDKEGWSAFEKKDEAKAVLSDAAEPKKERRKPWVRDAAEEPEIKGISLVLKADPAAFKSKFRLTAVQPGENIPDVEYQYHLRHAETALTSLADVIGAAPEDISLNGRLGLAFAARGRGKAAAHYEPAEKAINITRFRGAGSVAHEWGHFLDNVMSEVHAGADTSGRGTFASEGAGHANMPPELKQAFLAITHAIRTPAPEELAAKKAAKARRLAALKISAEEANAKLQSHAATHGYKLTPELKAERAKLYDDYEALRLEHNHVLKADITASTFLMHASAFDGGKTKGYWTQGTEMFARAFESYVQDKLEDNSKRNSYLVDGTRRPYDTGVYASDGSLAQPYPQGEERKRINAAFDNLMAALKSTGALKKAQAWMDDLGSRD